MSHSETDNTHSGGKQTRVTENKLGRYTLPEIRSCHRGSRQACHETIWSIASPHSAAVRTQLPNEDGDMTKKSNLFPTKLHRESSLCLNFSLQNKSFPGEWLTATLGEYNNVPLRWFFSIIWTGSIGASIVSQGEGECYEDSLAEVLGVEAKHTTKRQRRHFWRLLAGKDLLDDIVEILV